MAVKPTLLLSPDGSFDANGRVEPTVTGGALVVPSDRNEWVETEGTTNLHVNPVLKRGVVTAGWLGWASTGAVYEEGRVEGYHSMFDYWFRVKSVDLSSGHTFTACMRPTIADLSGVVTASMWIAVSRAGTYSLTLATTRDGVSDQEIYKVYELGPTPQRVDITFDLGPTPASTRITWGFTRSRGVSGIENGDEVFLSGGQIEQKPYPTPLAVGDMEGHWWTDSPHNSNSVRPFSRKPAGKQINAWQIAEATTNLHTSPIPWATSGAPEGWYTTVSAGSSRIISIDTDFDPSYGPWRALELTSATSTGHTFQHAARATIGTSGTYTASLDIATSREMTVPIYVKVGGPFGTQLAVKYVTLGLTPTRVDLTFSATAGQEVHWGFLSTIGMYSVVAGDKVWITRPQLEANSYATPYVDGSMGAGHAWTGTPNASTSTREAAKVTLPLGTGRVNSDQGSVLIRYRRPPLGGTGNQWLVALGDYSSGRDFIGIRRGSGFADLSTYNGSSQVITPYSQLQTGSWEALYFGWTPESVQIKSSSGDLVNGDRAEMAGVMTGLIRLGHYGGTHYPNAEVESVLFFDTPLTDAEIAEYMGMGALTYNNTFGPSTDIAFPDIRSGLHLVETKIHKSDMYGNIGDEITGEVVAAGITSDLDRAGSKTHIDITAVGAANLLPAGSWITPVQEVSREGEGTVQIQRGVFELDQPEVESAGVRFIVSNSGKDIVDLLARSALLDTFYTPPKGWVMNDVKLAIRMLGITSMGPNFHPNGDFEDDTGLPAGWTIWGSGDITVNTVADTVTPVPSGKYLMRHIIPSGQPSTAYAVAHRSMTLPASLEKVLITGMYYKKDAIADPFMYIEWLDAGAATIKIEYFREVKFTENNNMVWTRAYGVSERPEGAALLRVLTRTNTTDATTGSLEVLWDDIQVRAITGDLLPESMITMPPNMAAAASRMQHLTSEARLAAVNDRLAAIGMMAVNATNDSKYTSRMSRDPNKDAAVRQYDIEKDIRITGDIQTWRNTSNKYNRVFAVKEDYTEGTTMTAIAENKDLEDPWNIYRSVLTPKRIDVRDAVDMATLQLAADQELAKASMQESVSFSIVPDPTLSVYDIIEITGPSTNPAIGKWAIESIDSGLTASDPLMNIGARRTKKGV